MKPRLPISACAFLSLSFLVFIGLASDAAAQNESVTVTAQSLIGPWRIAQPTWLSIQGMTEMKFTHGPLRDTYCRIEEIRKELRVFCMGRRDVGTVDLDGADIHFAWGTMMAREVFDGRMQSNERFSAKLGLKLSGVIIAAVHDIDGRKVDQSVSAPDAGGMAGLLKVVLDSLAKGAPDARLKGTPPNVELPGAESLTAMGALESIYYAGRTPTRAESQVPDEKPFVRNPDAPEFSHVYVVEFERGERLCRIHQADGGVIDAFSCV
jgi:hypothetical protein